MKGKLDYEIGWANYESFIANYKLQKRRVISQIINFTLEEKQKLFEALQTNIQPQNKSYSYDFFYNNCATKIKDALVNASNKSILFLPLENFENEYPQIKNAVKTGQCLRNFALRYNRVFVP